MSEKTKRNQAVESVIVPKGESRGNNGAQGNGLNGQGNRPQCFDASRLKVEGLSSVLSCAVVPCRAILFALVRKNGGGRGNPLVSIRRTIAASCFARGVSFGGSRIHGVIASAFLGALHPQFLMGSRAGGFRACRFRMRGISTPHGLPSPWKGSAVLQTAYGALTMMRTLSRNVSTAFPSIPEPVFHPAESRHNRASSVQKVDAFSDVADAVETLMERCVDAYADAGRLPSVRRTCARNVIRSYVEELVAFCKEVESIPSRSFTIKEA